MYLQMAEVIAIDDDANALKIAPTKTARQYNNVKKHEFDINIK